MKNNQTPRHYGAVREEDDHLAKLWIQKGYVEAVAPPVVKEEKVEEAEEEEAVVPEPPKIQQGYRTGDLKFPPTDKKMRPKNK